MTMIAEDEERQEKGKCCHFPTLCKKASQYHTIPTNSEIVVLRGW